MTKTVKIWLCVAALLVLAGSVLFFGALALNKFDLTNYQTNEYEIDEEFNAFSLSSEEADISLVLSENAKPKVICYEQEKVKHAVSVQDGVLTVQATDTREWYERIGIHFGKAKITVELPLTAYGALTVNSKVGDIRIPKDFAFDKIEISVITGDVDCRASTAGGLKITTTTGDIRVQESKVTGGLALSVTTGDIAVEGVVCDDFTLKVTTGRGDLKTVSCTNFSSSGSTGDIVLEGLLASGTMFVQRSTGDIRLNGCDAAELTLKTSTGDVTGTLLTKKNFIASAGTGKVQVPDTKDGGRCEITTGTGDIKLQIKE